MSLVRTLAKVAAGILVAKAVKGVTGGGARRAPRQQGTATGGGLGDLLGQVLGGGSTGRSGGGGMLPDALGKVLSGRGTPGGGSRGGSLGAELDKLSRMSRPGGSSAAAGGSMFGQKLDQSLSNFSEPENAPGPDDEQLAGVMLRAMIQAAKADGRIDPAEKAKLLEHLGDVSADELQFVNAELQRDADPEDLARSVPDGAGPQVYMLSVVAIDLDENSEAQYLQDLARALGIDSATANAVHDQLGQPRIFR